MASALAKIGVTDGEMEQLRSFLDRTRSLRSEQEAFFDYCKSWKLAPWAAIQLERLGLSALVDPEVMARFSAEHELVREANNNRVKAALKFLALFREQGIEVAVLKGNLFMDTVYHDRGYKRMNDYDMLIRPENWVKAQEIYDKLGYIPLGFGWGGEKQEAASFSHAGMSFISPDFACITGTQWGLKSPTSRYNKNIIGGIWDSCTPHMVDGLEVKKLSPEYNLLHLVLHMGLYKIGIRDCMDVFNLLATETINEELYLRIAEEAGAIDKSYFTLALTNLCSGDVSPGLLAQLGSRSKGFIRRRLEKRLEMAERTGDMQLSYNDYFHDVEMVVFNFNLFTKFHQRLPIFFKVFGMMFWPKMDLALRFCDNADRPTFFRKLVARLKAPYFTFSLIGEEIGVAVTMLLFVKLFVDLFASLGNYFVKRENYFDYLAGRGVDPKDIKAVVKNIQ